jgi:hypothetical protein
MRSLRKCLEEIWQDDGTSRSKGGKSYREREGGREVLLNSILRWLVNFYFCKPSHIASLPKKTLVHPSTINIAW